MPTLKAPGVYIEEAPTLPATITPVATAIPVFIGYTERARGAGGEDLYGKVVRLTSLAEYTAFYGEAPVQRFAIRIRKRVNTAGRRLGVDVMWQRNTPPQLPTHYLYYSLQLYFANGGGPCYVYAIGPYGGARASTFKTAITALEAVDEPTLLVFPDAVKLTDAGHASVVNHALGSCNRMRDRFTIADVRNAVVGGTDSNDDITRNFRSRLSGNPVEAARYGAAYFPYLKTRLPFRMTDQSVTLRKYQVVEIMPDGSENPVPLIDVSNRKLSDRRLDLRNAEKAVYSKVRRFISRACVTLPPSGAVAGIYAQLDRDRGVWKSPANVAVAAVRRPAVTITRTLQDRLNVDSTTGRSINAVRSFRGRGTVIWGARTLAGNDNEWRYVSVRRLVIMVEESIKNGLQAFAFEPNEARTWVKIRDMTAAFLYTLWRDGAFAGAKPEEAFGIAVGQGETMTAHDIEQGKLIVDVRLAILRPAEFIILRLIQRLSRAPGD